MELSVEVLAAYKMTRNNNTNKFKVIDYVASKGTADDRQGRTCKN
jgi:hypothetical protein